MALAISIDLGNGFTATYHRVCLATVDRNAGITQVAIESYKDQATRTDNLGAIARRSAPMIQGVPGDADGLYQWCYDAIKVQAGLPGSPVSEFFGATDV